MRKILDCKSPEAKTETSEASQRVVLKFGDTRTGHLVGLTPEGDPLVDFNGNPTLGHLRARSCIDISPRDLGREVVLLFNDGDSTQPLVIGMLRGAATPTVQASNARASLSTQVESDGVHVQVSAREKLTLRCGLASVTLTHDGGVHIEGTYVQSSAQRTNRILGGSVQIN